MAIRHRGDALQIDVQVTYGGTVVRHREKFVGDMQQAKAREAKIKAALLSGEDPSRPGGAQAGGPRLTLERALEDTWERYWANAAVARTVRSNMKTAIDFFGASKLISEITTSDAERYIDHLKGRGLSASTVRAKAACLTRMFNYMHRAGKVRIKPYFELPKIGNNMRDRVISDAEGEALVHLFEEAYDAAMPRRKDGKSGQDWADLVVFLMDTGCRPSEARALIARCQRGDLMDFKITKTDRPRTLPLTDRSREAWERQTARLPKDEACPFLWATPDAFRHAWDWARECMGLGDDRGFIPYALRHTCATRLYARTRDLMLVSKWLGHTNIQMTMRYAKLDPDDLVRARDLLQGSAPRPALRSVTRPHVRW